MQNSPRYPDPVDDLHLPVHLINGGEHESVRLCGLPVVSPIQFSTAALTADPIAPPAEKVLDNALGVGASEPATGRTATVHEAGALAEAGTPLRAPWHRAARGLPFFNGVIK
jgi:hypothetical protein